MRYSLFSLLLPFFSLNFSVVAMRDSPADQPPQVFVPVARDPDTAHYYEDAGTSSTPHPNAAVPLRPAPQAAEAAGWEDYSHLLAVPDTSGDEELARILQERWAQGEEGEAGGSGSSSAAPVAPPKPQPTLAEIAERELNRAAQQVRGGA